LLSSQLFPYDSDAPDLIGGWISELEKIGSIFFYIVDGNRYLQITKWHKHQKIEKPTASRLPEFNETSPTCRRILSDVSPPGPWTLDLGPSILDQKPPTPLLTHQPAQTALPGAGGDSPNRKRREKKTDTVSVDPVMIPSNLIADFHWQEAWERWQVYRNETGNPMTISTRNALLERMAIVGPDVASKAISKAIERGWLGPVLDDADEPEKVTLKKADGLRNAAYRPLERVPIPPLREIICTLSREEIEALLADENCDKTILEVKAWRKWNTGEPTPRDVQYFLRRNGHAVYADGGDAHGPLKGSAT
jgi:hypothetical protein